MLRVLKVLIVDDHSVVRRGVEMVLKTSPQIQIAGEADSGEAAIDAIERLEPDVVIMDVMMPGMDGIEATHQISERFPNVRIIGLSSPDETAEARMLANGAAAFIRKDAPVQSLLEAVLADS